MLNLAVLYLESFVLDPKFKPLEGRMAGEKKRKMFGLQAGYSKAFKN